MMGDHPRKREVCSLGNLSTSSRDQAEGLGSLTELQSLRKHRSKFQAKHQSPEYKAGNQNRDRDNGVSETPLHHTWHHTSDGHKIRRRLTGHCLKLGATGLLLLSSIQSPVTKRQSSDTRDRGKWQIYR